MTVCGPWRSRLGRDGQAIDVHDDGLVLVTGAESSSGGLPVGMFVYDLTAGTYTPLPVSEVANLLQISKPASTGESGKASCHR